MGQELWRVVQDQKSYYKKIDGLEYEEAYELNVLLETSKPLLNNDYEEWDELIYSPFRYPLPVGLSFGSRFKPPGSSYNILYAALQKDTSFAETCHHFLLERLHLPDPEDEVVEKTLFAVDLISEKNLFDARGLPNLQEIMSDDYQDSFQIAVGNEKSTGFIYPSARIEHGINYALKDINLLGKTIEGREPIAYKFLAKSKMVEVSKYLGEKIFEFKPVNIFA